MSDFVFGCTVTALGMVLASGLAWVAATRRARRVAPGARTSTRSPGAPVALSVRGEGADQLSARALAALAVAVSEYAAARRRQAAPEMRATRPGARLFASRWLASGRTQQTNPFSRRR